MAASAPSTPANTTAAYRAANREPQARGDRAGDDPDPIQERDQEQHGERGEDAPGGCPAEESARLGARMMAGDGSSTTCGSLASGVVTMATPPPLAGSSDTCAPARMASRGRRAASSPALFRMRMLLSS